MKTVFTKIFLGFALVFVYGSLAVSIFNIVREAIAYKNDPVIAEINRRELEARIPGDRVPPIIEEEDRNPDGVEDFSLNNDEDEANE